MTFLPWRRRAEEEQKRRRDAELRLAEIQSDWKPVHAQVAEWRYHQNLNGWTGVVDILFHKRHGE